nr:MAG TPA: hypothetical protein [Caudoviricetes sp.]
MRKTAHAFFIFRNNPARVLSSALSAFPPKLQTRRE